MRGDVQFGNGHLELVLRGIEDFVKNDPAAARRHFDADTVALADIRAMQDSAHGNAQVGGGAPFVNDTFLFGVTGMAGTVRVDIEIA